MDRAPAAGSREPPTLEPPTRPSLRAIGCVLGFAAGIALADRLALADRRPIAAFGGAVAVAIGAALVVARHFPGRKRPGPNGTERSFAWWSFRWRRARGRVALAADIALFAGLGALRVSILDAAPEIGFASGPSLVRGIVVESPVEGLARDDASVFSFAVRVGSRDLDVRQVLPAGSAAPRIPIGATVELRGRIVEGDPPYLRALSADALRVAGESPFWRHPFLVCEAAVAGAIDSTLSAESGLFRSLFLGDRRSLSEPFRRALIETGTYHFLAISGLHVGILCVVIARFPFREKIRAVVRPAMLVVFVVITGAASPVVRAALMTLLFWIGNRGGRVARPVDTLFWTAFIILAADPGSLDSLGFQLSFAAVLGILVWGRRLAVDPLGALRARQGPWRARLARAIWRSLAVSFAASAATAPLIAYAFGRIHPWSAVLSVALLPLVAATLTAGFLCILAALIAPLVAEPLAVPSVALAASLEALVVLLAELPGVAVEVPHPGPWETAAASLALYLPIVIADRRSAGFAVLAVVAALATSASIAPPSRIVHFDVGDGSAALITLPDGAGHIAIDAGARTERGAERLSAEIRRCGARRLSALMLTHAHSDHAGAARLLIDRFAPRHVWVSPHFSAGAAGAALIDDVLARGIAVTTIASGDEIRLPTRPDIAIRVLHPLIEERLPLAALPNETSLCVVVEIGAATQLFTGDIEEPGTARLLQNRSSLRAGVLVLPHHGRRNRIVDALVAAVEPDTIIISGRGGGGARENAERLRASGLRVAATWEGGAIECRADGDRWSTRHLAAR